MQAYFLKKLEFFLAKKLEASGTFFKHTLPKGELNENSVTKECSVTARGSILAEPR
jgi:hypothetical protein